MDVAVLISLEGMKTGPSAANKPYINQDRAFIVELGPKFTAYGVFDGHGAQGHHVAEFVCNLFKSSIQNQYRQINNKLLDEEIFRFIQDLFALANYELGRAGIDIDHSGCTGSVAIRYYNKIYVGYVGDSKVATVHFQGKKPYCLMETPEHNPACPGEVERIKQCGSNVSIVRVPLFTKPISRIIEAGLSVSRSFGDLAARSYGVTAIPDLLQFEINEQAPNDPTAHTRYPVILILASDGLWDTATYMDLLEHVNNNVQPQQKLLARTKKLAEVAWRRRIAAEGRADDTTVIVALIK